MFDYLKDLYAQCGNTDISQLFDESRDEVSTFLSEHQLDLIINDFKKNTQQIAITSLLEQPSGLLQIAMLTNAVFLKLSENETSPKIQILKTVFKDCLSEQVSLIIEKSKDQLRKLGDFLNYISDQYSKTGQKNACVLELPVGNSIPSILLKKILELKGVKADIITISLNRNDSKKIGITREKLIQEKLKEIDFESTLLIYIDEWISGSNFNNIITILSKVKGLKFLPCAFMTEESQDENKYQQYVLEHQKLCQQIGFTSKDLLIQLPTLNSTLGSNQKFIWTENDRLAGYRKLEFVGSIISTFIDTGEMLSQNVDTLDQTLQKAIREKSSLDANTAIPDDFKQKIVSSLEYFNSVFVLALKETVDKTETNSFDEFSLEKETDKVIKLFEDTTGYNEAKLALNIINYHMTNTVISPTSRYFYKGRVPLCLPLEGDERFLHLVFVQKAKEILSLTQNC